MSLFIDVVSKYPDAAELGELYRAAGFELYLVGGIVRDNLLDDGGHFTDFDLTTDATPEQSEQILCGWGEHTWDIGKEYGTISARKNGVVYEVTTYRAEVYVSDSRKPTVEFGTDLSADLVRRDFTINAMAAALPSGEVVDLFGGVEDLRAGVLRTPRSPEESFSEDPLRMMRAARFAARFNLEVAPEVFEAMREMAGRIEIISAERVRDELVKLMEKETDEDGPCPAPDFILRFAALMHDIGKPKTRKFEKDGSVSFLHHEVVGAKMVKKRMRALRFDNDTIKAVARLVELHMRFYGYRESGWTDSAVRRYVRDAGDQLERLHRVSRSDVTTRNRRLSRSLAEAYDDLERRIAELAAQEELDSIRPDLDGGQIMQILGIAPGPVVGEAYKFLLNVRLDEGSLPEEEAKARLLQWWEQRREA